MSLPAGSVRDIRTARRALTRFLLALPFLAVVPLALRWRWGGSSHPGIDFACVALVEWVPALAAVIALGAAAPFGLGLGLPRARALAGFALAVAAPLAVAMLSYGIAWATRLAPFTPPDAPAWVRGGAWGAMTHSILSHFSRGLGAWLLLALGEEIGWRGFLAVQLRRADLPVPLLLCGLIWSAWHWPSMLLGTYPAGPDRMLSLLGLTLTLTSFSYVLIVLRFSTASVWPAALSHAIWNSFFFDSFEGATRASTPWTRESGMLTAAATLVVAALTVAFLGSALRSGGTWGGSRRGRP
jgi:membrane protease YdiL (CAAX protease family)